MANVLKMSDARKAIELNFATGQTLAFMGASGIGKTHVAWDYVSDQPDDYGMFEINLALASLPDIIGLQNFFMDSAMDRDGNLQTFQSARFAYPYFMRDKRKGFEGRPAFACRGGMILIEEYGQGEASCKRAIGQLLQEGRAGEHSFGPGFNCLVLSNRPEDRSGVTKDFDFLINRRTQVEVQAELDGWLVWAHSHGVSNMSMAFAARNEVIVFANKAPEKQGPWMTPRSLADADRLLMEAFSQKYHLDDPFVRINLAGKIGEGTAHTFIAFAKIRDQLPSYKSIVDDPDGADVPDQPDQMMFLVFDLAAKVDRTNMKAITTYMKRLPQDFALAFYRSCMHRDPTLRSTKEFGDWAVENVQLLSAVTAG